MKKVRILFFLLSVHFTVTAQLNNEPFVNRLQVSPEDSGRLYLGINAMGFSKDNEYFSGIIDGYTLYGYQLAPGLSYQFAPYWRIDAGAWLQKDFGNKDYTTIAPIFTIKHQKNHISTIFGNLEGSLNHRLIEPLYDFERVLDKNRLEQGGQIIIERENLFLDAWIDWQLMQYPGDTRQEELTGGISAEKKLTRIGGWNFSVPLQVVMKHKGGQLDINPLPLTTLLNSAAGLNTTRELFGFFRQIRLSNYLLYYKDMSFTKRQLFKDGSGIYLNLNLKARHGLEAMISYWRGHEFLTIQGGKIYPSQGVYDGSIIQPKMNMLMLRLLYAAQVNETFSVAARVEPYYDFSFRQLQYAFGIYLIYKERFFLGQPRRR
jgi:hypothetical protein